MCQMNRTHKNYYENKCNLIEVLTTVAPTNVSIKLFSSNPNWKQSEAKKE